MTFGHCQWVLSYCIKWLLLLVFILKQSHEYETSASKIFIFKNITRKKVSSALTYARDNTRSLILAVVEKSFSLSHVWGVEISFKSLRDASSIMIGQFELLWGTCAAIKSIRIEID